MNAAYYFFGLIFALANSTTVVSYLRMRDRVNKTVPRDQQLPLAVHGSWGELQFFSTYFGVADEYRKQFPNGRLPVICSFSFFTMLAAFVGLIFTAFVEMTVT
jgi:hypothetical protein